MSKIITYEGEAPFPFETHDRVSKEDLTKKQKKRLVAYERCDGGNGRCKCDSFCEYGVLKK